MEYNPLPARNPRTRLVTLLTELQDRLNQSKTRDELVQKSRIANQLMTDLSLPIRVSATKDGAKINLGYTKEIYEPQLRELAVFVDEI